MCQIYFCCNCSVGFELKDLLMFFNSKFCSAYSNSPCFLIFLSFEKVLRTAGPSSSTLCGKIFWRNIQLSHPVTSRRGIFLRRDKRAKGKRKNKISRSVLKFILLFFSVLILLLVIYRCSQFHNKLFSQSNNSSHNLSQLQNINCSRNRFDT